jgi:predicted CXXCH cytochrome family protein
MKRVLAIITAVAITAAATAAFATIVGSKHDLSRGNSNGLVTAGGSDQICVYCHTPHNAVENIPLWNRNNPATTTFKFYSSPTMQLHRPVANTGTFESTSISLFCMSCHDGGAIGGRIASAASPITGGTLSTDAISGKALLGTDLSNDHPVNLQMLASTAGLYNPSANTIGNGLTKKLSLFKGTSGDNYLECSSCHAVHDNTVNKFLRTTNSGSKLCLACHDK